MAQAISLRELSRRAQRPMSTLKRQFVPATVACRSLVVLPTYNERENIAPIVSAILGQSDDLEVLVVDDNSPNGTGQIAERLAREFPPG